MAAASVIEDGTWTEFLEDRYADWDGEFGKWVMSEASLADIADKVAAGGIDPKPKSGRQEYLENLINAHL